MLNTTLPFIDLHRPSFWLGFLAGSLFIVLLNRLKPFLADIPPFLKERYAAARQGWLAGMEVRHRNETLRLAQSLHLAAPLFALDEIIIPPQVLAPPLTTENSASGHEEQLVEQVLPYLPDWPELAAIYDAPTLTLPEALSGGVNLAITGQPGSGKTVALSYLATLLARCPSHKDLADLGDLCHAVPFLVHVADIELPVEGEASPLEVLTAAIAAHASPLSLPRLPRFVRTVFSSGRAVLLLDGLDELPQTAYHSAVAFLASLLAAYPGTRAVVTLLPVQGAGLEKSGFVRLPLAVWNQKHRASFVKQWSDRWTECISPAAASIPAIDPIVLTSWMVDGSARLNPFDLTLRTWAVFAGDIPGSTRVHAIEAYIRRLLGSSADSQTVLQGLASQFLLNQQTVCTRKQAETWAAEALARQVSQAAETPPPANPRNGTGDQNGKNGHDTTDIELEPGGLAEEGKATDSQAVNVLPLSVLAPQKIISGLLEAGLLALRNGSRLGFAYPVLAGILAVREQDPLVGPGEILDQPEWMVSDLALQAIASQSLSAPWITEQLFSQEKHPDLQAGLFRAARWLPQSPIHAEWAAVVLRHLAAVFQNESQPFSQRARALAALCSSEAPGVANLMYQALSSPSAYQRQLAALGCGVVGDIQCVPQLGEQLYDPSPNVQRAGALALIVLGLKPAVDAVASALLHGDDHLRQIAAESLARDSDQGHSLLREASQMEDLLIRRAAVAGLANIHQPWAEQILRTMSIEDSQWVVKNAAAQAMEERDLMNPRIPRPLPELHEAPWLITFAASRGLGVLPGKHALEMLTSCLRDGNGEQQIAALDYIVRSGNTAAAEQVGSVYQISKGEVREKAFTALWQLAAMGAELSLP